MSKLGKPFQKAVKKQQVADVFDYAREVRRAWHDHPETKDAVIFWDVCENELIHPGDPKRAMEISDVLHKDDRLQAEVRDYLKEKTSCNWPVSYDTNAILLYTQAPPFRFLSKTATDAQELTFVFDHEFGHALTDDLRGDKLMSECVADAYAVIRHFQRYGANSTAIDALPHTRMMAFADKHDCNYLTSPVVKQILAHRHHIDWKKLTPEQTVEQARMFATMYAPNPEMRTFARRAFGDMDDLHKKSNMGVLARSVLLSGDPLFLTLALPVLQFCLDGKAPGVLLEGKSWDSIRQQLARKLKGIDTQRSLLRKPPQAALNTKSKKP